MENNLLNKQEQESLSELAMYANQHSISEIEYQQIIREIVRPVLPHQGLISGVGIKQLNRIHITHFVAVDYSIAFLTALSTKTTTHERPLMALWLETQKPMLVACIHVSKRMVRHPFLYSIPQSYSVCGGRLDFNMTFLLHLNDGLMAM